MNTTEILSFEKSKAEYESAWNDLVSSEGINPSLLPGWLECTYKAFGILNEIKVFILKQNNQLIGIQPFFVKKIKYFGIPLNTVMAAGNLVSYHQEFITRKNNVSEFIQAFIESLTKYGDWDVFSINDIVNTSASFSAIQQYSANNHYEIDKIPSDQSPYLLLNTSWKELLSANKRKFRYKVNKRESNLTTNEDYKLDWFAGGQNTNNLIQAILNIEENSWKRDEGMAITDSKIEKEYYRFLIPYLADNNMLDAGVLSFQGEPIAYNLCYKYNNCLGQIKTSFKQDFHKESPGAMLIEASLRRYFAENFGEFDFLGDIMPHKMEWANLIRKHESVYLFNKKFFPKTIGKFKKLKRKFNNLRHGK